MTDRGSGRAIKRAGGARGVLQRGALGSGGGWNSSDQWRGTQRNVVPCVRVRVSVCVCMFGICEFVCVCVITKTSVFEQRVSPRVNHNGQGVSCVGAITHGVVQSVASGVLTKKGVNFSKTPWNV